MRWRSRRCSPGTRSTPPGTGCTMCSARRWCGSRGSAVRVAGDLAVPTLAELAEVAARTVERLEATGQVTALWERTADAGGVWDALIVTVTAVHEGRAARAVTRATDDAALARAA